MECPSDVLHILNRFLCVAYRLDIVIANIYHSSSSFTSSSCSFSLSVFLCVCVFHSTASFE